MPYSESREGNLKAGDVVRTADRKRGTIVNFRMAGCFCPQEAALIDFGCGEVGERYTSGLTLMSAA